MQIARNTDTFKEKFLENNFKNHDNQLKEAVFEEFFFSI